MTKDLTDKYMANRTFYKIQSEFLVDNPDQRISADIRAFTDTAVSLSVVVLNSIIDLVSFSEILYSIYPPLFVALVVYSVGGTWVSVKLGQPLVGLNFKQEAQEADLRWFVWVWCGGLFGLVFFFFFFLFLFVSFLCV